MDQSKLPTKESIEAVLSMYRHGPDLASGELSDQMKVFDDILASSKELQAAVMGLTVGLANTSGMLSLGMAEIKRRAKAGDINAVPLMRISIVCNTFFWVGWHARGAAEDAEKLKGMDL